MRNRFWRSTGRRDGQGLGRRGGPKAAGPGGKCVCPQCGYKLLHTAGQPCEEQKCPQCKTPLIRE